MMRRFALALLTAAAAASAGAEAPAPYSRRAEVRAFVAELVAQQRFVRAELEYVFERARREPAILRAIQPKAPHERLTWSAYRARFVNDRYVADGVEFWDANRDPLARAERRFGVPADVIVAILGVETRYGRNMGRWRVVDALTTLAFDYPPRARFFRDQLAEFLLLARDSGYDVFSVRGSYAGAIGIPQFMPGSYLRYALDFDGDGAVDLRASAADAVGSVGNFLQQHGWQPGEPVLAPAEVSGDAYRRYADEDIDPRHTVAQLASAGVSAAGLPPQARAALIELRDGDGVREYRLGLRNFYVLTRYNRSSFYACAVMDLAAALRAARQLEGK
jgi:membrane-bound lytic murein transglycosylase B